MATPLRSGVHAAATEAEREAIYRFRYEVYVREMGRYRGIADHARRRLMEPEDTHSRLFYAGRDGEIVGTARLTWGGDGPLSARQVEQFQLAPFLAELPRAAIAVGERGMVAPGLRGSTLFTEIVRAQHRFANAKRIQLLFGACEPHFLSLYLGQGCRTYAARNINSPEAGYLVPIVTVIEDVAYLRSIGSPEVAFLRDFGTDARVPACVEHLIGRRHTVMSQRLTSERAYWGEVHRALSELAPGGLSALDGLTEDEAVRCLGKSNILACQAGDRVLKKGSTGRNMFVVLDGALEVRDGASLVRVLGPGDVFGEMAFLLERPRTMDVFAATDGVRVLSLSERTVREMIARDADVTAHLLLNIAKMLCRRLLQST